MSGGKRPYQRPSLQNVLECEFFIKTLIEISQMVNCRSEEWKTFDVQLLWTFDSVSLADTVRSWWSLSTATFSISLFSFNLQRIPFEKRLWNGWNPSSAASPSHLNTALVISEPRDKKKKKEMWRLSAESVFHRPEWSRTTKGAQVILVWLSFSSTEVFFFPAHISLYVGNLILSFFNGFRRWLTFVISELSHQGWTSFHYIKS